MSTTVFYTYSAQKKLARHAVPKEKARQTRYDLLEALQNQQIEALFEVKNGIAVQLEYYNND